jgi:hypothetical protein
VTGAFRRFLEVDHQATILTTGTLIFAVVVIAIMAGVFD